MGKQRFRDIKQGRGKKFSPDKGGKQIVSLVNASITSRIKSFITDSFMLTMPLMYIVFYLVFDGREGFAAHKLLGWTYILFPLALLQIIFMSRSRLGQTPGMKAYELSLVNIKDGQKPKFSIIVARQLLSILTLPIFGWGTMFFTKGHRTLHEILTGTTLVQLIPKIPENKSR